MLKTVASKNEIIQNLRNENKRLLYEAHMHKHRADEAAGINGAALAHIRELEIKLAEAQRVDQQRNHMPGALARERANLADVQARLNQALEGKGILKREIAKLRDPWRAGAGAAAYLAAGAIVMQGWVRIVQ